jgi:N-acetyl-gamma-glutamyl-phosphate reductase
MVKHRVFVDGADTPIGLTIWDLLWDRKDVELSCYEPLLHDGSVSRIELARDADFVFLCANVSSSSELIKNLHPSTRVIDTSGAYLDEADAACGVPELFRENTALIYRARVVGIPHAVATAATALLHPLIESEYLNSQAPISVHALQGYSAMDEKPPGNESEPFPTGGPHALRTVRTAPFDRILKEIGRWTHPPRAIQLVNSIGNFPRGTAVHIPLLGSNLTPGHTLNDAYALLERWYLDSCHVRIKQGDGSAWGVSIEDVNHTNLLELFCMPGTSAESGLLVGRLDNLGRGSARAAVQALNIMLDKRADFSLDRCLQAGRNR